MENLKEKIIQANEKYRIGNPIISDSQFDELVDELETLSPDDELLSKIGHTISDESRKKKLPIEMASMNKVKSVDEIFDWIRLKKIPKDIEFVITPKYDGLSFCVNELTNEAWTRGDGTNGQKSDTHYKFIGNKHKSPNRPEYSYGEAMIPKQTFIDKYSVDFANPRNLMAGLINAKEISEILKDSVYIKYGIVDSSQTEYTTKSLILDYLNDYQEIKVPYEIINFNDLNKISINDYLVSLFYKWSKDFEIDGLVIEVNNISLQEKLGRETSSRNPVYNRAFKSPLFEQSAESEVTGISWNISKNNLLKPIIHIKPIKLDGVTVSNITGNNAKFIKENGIGTGARLEIKRSGMVIPKVINVIKKVKFQIPVIENVEIGWNENGVELVVLTETDDQKLKEIISFCKILGFDNVSEGTCEDFFNRGYKTIKDILYLKQEEMETWSGWGLRSAEIVYNSIHSKLQNVPIEKLQHGSNLFKGLGSRKLALLKHFKVKPSLDDVMKIDGFSEISANSYLNGYDKFNDFIKDLPITIEDNKLTEVITNDKTTKMITFEMTGSPKPLFENKQEFMEFMEKHGFVHTGMNKETNLLVTDDLGSISGKMKKAIKYGTETKSYEQVFEEIK